MTTKLPERINKVRKHHFCYMTNWTSCYIGIAWYFDKQEFELFLSFGPFILHYNVRTGYLTDEQLKDYLSSLEVKK